MITIQGSLTEAAATPLPVKAVRSARPSCESPHVCQSSPSGTSSAPAVTRTSAVPSVYDTL